MNRNPPPARRRAAAAVLAAAALSAACGANPPAPAPVAVATTGPAQACAAYAELSTMAPPGVDPSGPPPAPEEVQEWAAAVEPVFAVFRDGAPPELADQVAVLDGQLDGARQGQPIDAFDPAGSVASNVIGEWVHADCGFPTLDVAFDGTALSGAPESLPAGPVAVEFRNTDPDRPAFVLLLATVAAGQEVTAADVDAGRADVDAVATVATAALPTGPDPAYSVAVLQPGPHLLTVPLGSAPDFTGSASLDLAVR
jgi:hypothetical protein